MTEDGDAKAHDYREGFREGAAAILEIVGDALPEEKIRVIERWIEGPLTDWRKAGPDAARPQFPMLDGA